MRERTRVVVNPAAGAGRCAARAEAARPILEAAWDLEWCASRDEAHLVALVREAAEAGATRVVVAGGDGSAHAAAHALANTRTALAILPVGTGNDLAASVGVPRDPEAAARTLVLDQSRAVDLGGVGSRVFGCVLGVGMDTEALRRINSARFLRRGRLLYSLCAARTLLTYRPRRMRIRWESGSFEGEVVFAAVTNTATYAGGMRIAPGARVDDGALDLCIIPRMSLWRTLTGFHRVLEGKHVGMPGVRLARSPWVSIEADEPVPVTLDGELTDIVTPVAARVLPRALRLLGVAA